jgi:hypothetical protein
MPTSLVLLRSKILHMYVLAMRWSFSRQITSLAVRWLGRNEFRDGGLADAYLVRLAACSMQQNMHLVSHEPQALGLTLVKRHPSSRNLHGILPLRSTHASGCDAC